MKHLTNIDLAKNELQNALVHKLASAPSSPVEGQIYHDTTAHHVFFYTGSGWFDVTNALTLNGNAETLYARLASPTFTGTPAAPTASGGTNTTQVATTAYVVSEIASRLAAADAMIYKGAIDASTNPNYPAADAGFTYRISVAGKIGGASGVVVEAGDMLICHVDSSAGGVQASFGADWDVIQTNIDGAVTLTSTQTLTNKTLTTPTIADHTNAQHNHTNAAGGGQLAEGALLLTNITTNDVTSTKHGFAPKSGADATTFLNGATTPAYAQVKDSDLSTSDVTTNNVSITKHGFAPKAPNDATKYLDGTGAYSTPSGAALRFSQDVGDNTSTAIVITHSLGTRDLHVSLRSNTTPWEVNVCDVEMTSTATVTLRFSAAPTTAQYRVTILG